MKRNRTLPFLRKRFIRDNHIWALQSTRTMYRIRRDRRPLEVRFFEYTMTGGFE